MKWHDAAFIFARNIVHGDMLFFPMIARFYDWKEKTWTTLEEMNKEENKFILTLYVGSVKHNHAGNSSHALLLLAAGIIIFQRPFCC